MKVRYQRERHPCKETRPEYMGMPLTAGPAFAMSKQGRLVHRVRCASVIRAFGPRVVCRFWCGNSTGNAVMFAVPSPTDHFCARCEAYLGICETPTERLLGWKPMFCRQSLSCMQRVDKP